MKWILSITVLLVLSILALVFYARDHPDDAGLQMYVPFSLVKMLRSADDQFAAYDIPLKQSYWVFDVGIVDVNSDDYLDIFTTNHNWIQHFLVADAGGGYSDEPTAWGLNQSNEFPGLELSHNPPVVDEPGLYLYWEDRYFYVRAHDISGFGKLELDVQTYTKIDVISNEGFELDGASPGDAAARIPDTRLALVATGNAHLKVYPISRGVPINIQLKSSLPLDRVYVGNRKVSPSGNKIVLSLKDPHALAWSDFNDDGQIDVFTTRGAIGGTLRIHPESIIRITKDELRVSDGGKPVFRDVGLEDGIEKNFCSSRHASWVDYNNDGLLDLFVNCQDVGKVTGDYPKQLYQRDRQNRLRNVAAEAGLAIKDHHLIDYEWLDADNDGDMDLVSYEDSGYFLHRNENGVYAPEFIYRGKFVRADHPELQGRGIAYWNFDGKLTAADFDRDGDIDVFAASKKGNVLLENQGGEFLPVGPASIGLPEDTVSAAWVDYDNDGLLDLHTVPEGLFQQRQDHSFEKTNQLELPVRKYQAAIINWFDLDNDGSRDVVITLNENPSLSRWWEIFPKDPFKWDVLTYRNLVSDHHWLQIKLRGGPGNREAIGARVTVTTPDGRQVQEVGGGDGAFFSQGHYRLYYGLGEHEKAATIEIVWSDGKRQKMENVPSDQLLVIERENGTQDEV